MEYPFISVVIPVYNVEEYLDASLCSILQQTIQDIEIITINDGSQDSSLQILERYALKDSRVKVVSQENKGLSTARNTGLKLATGKYVYFFDSDDILQTTALETISKLAESTQAQIVHFFSSEIDESGNQLNRKNKHSGILQINPVVGQKFMLSIFNKGKYATNVQKYFYENKFLKEHQLTFPDGYIHEDESFTMIALCLAERVVSTDEALLLKRFRRNSIMSSERGISNVKGWVRASIDLADFSQKHTFPANIKAIIDFKITKLLNHGLRLMSRLKKKGIVKENITYYFIKEDLKKLGYWRYLQSRFLVLNRVTSKINRIIQRVKK